MYSDSSEEENLDLLLEATDHTFFNNISNIVEAKTAVENKIIAKPPSLRTKEDDDQFKLFNVTPQFQKYVSNALSAKIEKFLQESMEECYTKKKKKKQSNCVKLLRSSKYPIDINLTEFESVKVSQPKRKRKIRIEKSELESLTVSGEEILSKKGIEHWSNRSKAPIFRYVENKEGVLSYIEPEFK